MKLLAVGRNHDANICMYDVENGFFQYAKLERVFDEKHACFDARAVIDILNDYDFVPEVIGFDWGDEKIRGKLVSQIYDSNDIPCYSKYALLILDEVRRLLARFPNASAMWVDHHYAHVLSGGVAYGSDFDYGVAVDGSGPSRDATIIFKNPFDNAEAVYRNKFTSSYGGSCGLMSSFGRAYHELGLAMKLSGKDADLAGKVMGMQAYGKATPMNADARETICKLFLEKIASFDGEMCFENQEWLDLVSTLSKKWMDTLEALLVDYVPHNAKILFSGGAVQNTVFNERIQKLYPDAAFVPHCYDGGLSFGVLYKMCAMYRQPLPKIIGFPYLQRDEVFDQPSELTTSKVAKMLAGGKIVGWHQGRGEVGPRALGNRSILMNPAISGAKSILNEKVKHRECWRPYAASVLEEHASEWFEVDKPSPYMMRAIPVREGKKSVIPAVTHKDGTCRIQTVSREQNPVFYDLISEFHKLTEIPMLLNTSLNAGGKPISGHPDRSIALLKDSEMDALCVGSEIIS